MRKRKIKLLSTVAAMAMVLGVMGVGVYAATSQSLAISTTVSFVAKDCQVKVTALTAGTYISSATFGSAESKTNSAITLYDSYGSSKVTTSSYDLALTLTDNNVGYIPSGTTIGTITYTITNGSSDTLYLKPFDLESNVSSISVDVAYQTGTDHFATVSGKEGYSLDGTDSATVIVTLTSGSSNITSGITSTGLFTSSSKDMVFNFVNATGQLADATPWVYKGQYTASDLSGQFTDYYYLQFKENGPRWIIIGAGNSAKSTYLPSTAHGYNYQTDLGVNQLLLIRESQLTDTKTTENAWQSGAAYTYLKGYNATTNTNGYNYLTNDGIDTTASYFEDAMTLNTLISGGTTPQDTNAVGFFLLADNTTGQQFKIGDYLTTNSDDSNNNQAKALYTVNSSAWWVRSGWPSGDTDFAKSLIYDGNFFRNDAGCISLGVRPAFVLNLE